MRKQVGGLNIFMKKKLLLSILILSTFFTGCQKETTVNHSSVNEDDTEPFYDTEPLVEFKDEAIIPAGKEIVESDETYGTMKYTVTGYQEYDNIKKANLEVDDIIDPNTLFAEHEYCEKYFDVCDYVDEDGQVVPECTFVLINMKIENIDAVGIEKKNEFNISNICLYTQEPITEYYEAYFNNGFEDEVKAYHYIIEQGETKNVEIGFFVLNEDLEQVMGELNIGNNEVVKFELHE